METATDNLARLKAAYRVWDRSKGTDISAWLDLLADDVQLSTISAPSPSLAFAVDRRSKREVVDYLAGLIKDWSMVHWTPETWVADGDKIAMFGRCAWTNRATGKTAEMRSAHLWQFAGGKAASFTEIYDSARALAAATVVAG